MTYARYAALIDGHNRQRDPKARKRAEREATTWEDIAALKYVKVASG